MMKMRALKGFDYMGRRLRSGDVFEAASDAHKTLALALLAEPVEQEDKPKKRQKYKTRHMYAEDR